MPAGASTRDHAAGVCYLQEVLAGDDEGQLGAEVFCLSLAPSHPLNELRDVIGHCLQEERKEELSMRREEQTAKGQGKDPKCCCSMRDALPGTLVSDVGLHSILRQRGPSQCRIPVPTASPHPSHFNNSPNGLRLFNRILYN